MLRLWAKNIDFVAMILLSYAGVFLFFTLAGYVIMNEHYKTRAKQGVPSAIEWMAMSRKQKLSVIAARVAGLLAAVAVMQVFALTRR